MSQIRKLGFTRRERASINECLVSFEYEKHRKYTRGQVNTPWKSMISSSRFLSVTTSVSISRSVRMFVSGNVRYDPIKTLNVVQLYEPISKEEEINEIGVTKFWLAAWTSIFYSTRWRDETTTHINNRSIGNSKRLCEIWREDLSSTVKFLSFSILEDYVSRKCNDFVTVKVTDKARLILSTKSRLKITDL